MAEHLCATQKAAGSSPAYRSNFNNAGMVYVAVALAFPAREASSTLAARSMVSSRSGLSRLVVSEEIVGSNPTGTAIQ